MKYKIGDKVRYDGGDWWFYGTVSAAFEHSICPCYRLSVERMEKKNCKFSITQFEFELEAYNEQTESGKEKRKWENSEIEFLKKFYGVLDNDDLSKMLQRSSQAIEDKGRHIKSEPEPEKVKAETKLTIEPKTGKFELTQKPKEKLSKQEKDRAAWDKNFELYVKGVKNAIVYSWASYNRKQHNTGKLSKDKFEKLASINFPFNVFKKKNL